MDPSAVARHFDLGRVLRLSDGPVARGKQGLVWRLDSADGAWAVKVGLGRVREEDAAAVVAFQEAAGEAGVPTPAVRRTVSGEVLAVVGDRQVRVYEWVDLLPPDASLDPELVGRVVAALHQVPGRGTRPGPGSGVVDPWYADPVGPGRWDSLIGLLGEAGAPFAGRLAALRDELVAVEAWIEPPDRLRTCHRDLWADNLLPTAQGGACVIDWENSGPADPSQELACVLFEFGRSDPGRARALALAYRDAGGPGRVTRRGHFSMLVAQLGHIAETASRDWLEPNERSPSRAAAAAWVAEVLDDPHTEAVLGRLLEAVR